MIFLSNNDWFSPLKIMKIKIENKSGSVVYSYINNNMFKTQQKVETNLDLYDRSFEENSETFRVIEELNDLQHESQNLISYESHNLESINESSNYEYNDSLNLEESQNTQESQIIHSFKVVTSMVDHLSITFTDQNEKDYIYPLKDLVSNSSPFNQAHTFPCNEKYLDKLNLSKITVFLTTNFVRFLV